jgi:SnoaL-like domain
MHDNEAIAEKYLALWNEKNEAERRKRLTDQWSATARYVDPMMAGEGRHGIAEMIAKARSQFPGHSFVLRGEPDGHGDFVRFSWSLVPADGPAVAGGTDVVRLDDNGQISEVIGFLDKTAA